MAAPGAGRGGEPWSSEHSADKAEYSEREKALELVPGAVDDARVKIAEKPHAGAWFERVVPLVSGFEWLLGLELLATAHWVTTHEGATTEDAAIDQTHA